MPKRDVLTVISLALFAFGLFAATKATPVGNVPIHVEIGTAALLAPNPKAPGVDSLKESNAMTRTNTSRTLAVAPRMENLGKLWTLASDASV